MPCFSFRASISQSLILSPLPSSPSGRPENTADINSKKGKGERGANKRDDRSRRLEYDQVERRGKTPGALTGRAKKVIEAREDDEKKETRRERNGRENETGGGLCARGGKIRCDKR